MGSLISAKQLDRVTAHVDDAVSRGATVVAGGRGRPDIGPYYFEPTVLAGVTDDMILCDEETFGPVVAVYPVSSDEEAIRLANDTSYGLNAAVVTRDTAMGRTIAQAAACRHRQRQRGLRTVVGEHPRADGWHGRLRARPAPRRRGHC